MAYIMGLLLSLFKFFGWKYILNWIDNSRLNSDCYFVLDFRFYLMYILIWQKPFIFLSSQMAVLSSFFQVFIVHTWDV